LCLIPFVLGRVKAQRHDRFHSLQNCFSDPVGVRGQWQDYFKNTNPLHIEPGCGKAELSIGLAADHPEINFLAIDLKSDRLCRGADLALEKQLPNVAFLRMNAEKLTEAFLPKSLEAVWLTFPDPFPKDRDEKKRLTNPVFLQRYQTLLKPGGQVFLKTDNDGLAEYTLLVLKALNIPVLEYSSDLHAMMPPPLIARYLTSFEKKFLLRNKNIHYLRFEIPEDYVFFNQNSELTLSSLNPESNEFI
jgi:tRNA (guanine-N7-)-methyltransferase